ncbi:hypothetical protein EV182_002440, partial [Spiromyces aspiralis]
IQAKAVASANPAINFKRAAQPYYNYHWGSVSTHSTSKAALPTRNRSHFLPYYPCEHQRQRQQPDGDPAAYCNCYIATYARISSYVAQRAPKSTGIATNGGEVADGDQGDGIGGDATANDMGGEGKDQQQPHHRDVSPQASTTTSNVAPLTRGYGYHNLQQLSNPQPLRLAGMAASVGSKRGDSLISNNRGPNAGQQTVLATPKDGSAHSGIFIIAEEEEEEEEGGDGISSASNNCLYEGEDDDDDDYYSSDFISDDDNDNDNDTAATYEDGALGSLNSLSLNDGAQPAYANPYTSPSGSSLLSSSSRQSDCGDWHAEYQLNTRRDSRPASDGHIRANRTQPAIQPQPTRNLVKANLSVCFSTLPKSSAANGLPPSQHATAAHQKAKMYLPISKVLLEQR